MAKQYNLKNILVVAEMKQLLKLELVKEMLFTSISARLYAMNEAKNSGDY